MHQIFAGKHLHRRFAFSGKPLVECFDDAVTYDPGAQHTAVEQDVRRSRKPGALLAQELAEVPRDGRISRVRKPDLLEADAPAALRHVLARHYGKEPIEEDALKILPGQSCS